MEQKSEAQILIGIVGAGKNTQLKHIPNLQKMDDVQIVSVCNRTLQSSKHVAERFNIAEVYENWQELVAAEDTNAIVIGTWPYLHRQATLAALDAGKHVLVEARMAMDTAEARQMLQASEQKPHLVTQIVPSPLSFEVDATIKRLIREGFLGDILAIEIRDLRGEFLDKEAALQWRQDSRLSGVNVMSLGIWYETLMRWVGEAERVMAAGKVFVEERYDANQNRAAAVSIPEHLSVSADMACGAQATFFISQVAGLVRDISATLYGSKGTLRFTPGKLFGGQKGDSKLQEIAIPEEERSYWRVEEEFVQAIRGLEQIQYSPFTTGVKYMAFTEAVRRSIDNGRMVEVERL